MQMTSTTRAINIPAADARPGDLCFFTHEGKRPHHVGIVTGPDRMLHAPETGSLIVEEALTPVRQNSLIGAGRVTALEHGAGLTA
jgi:cell wall-associated NlpC family hydrolase